MYRAREPNWPESDPTPPDKPGAVQGPVLLVGNFLSGSGQSRGTCEDLAVRLSEAGWRVLCASAKTTRTGRLLDIVGTIWRSRDQYAVANVDVFSGRAFLLAEAACWTLRAAGKPYVLSLHGGRLPGFAARWPRRTRRLLRGAEAVTAPSRYLVDAMQRYRPDVRLLPNAVELDAYSFRPREAAEPRLVWLRAFHEAYNPSLAPKVLALLTREFPEVRLTMVGPDKGDGSLEAMWQVAKQLRVDDRILVTGAVTKAEVPAWMQQGDIFLNTTHFDNTPVSVVEAMACGLCVVSTNVGGMPYLVEHERDGLLVPTNDPEAMAAAVARLLKDRELACRLSREGRQKAERYNWPAVLAEWEAMLTGVCQRAPRAKTDAGTTWISKR
jgi:glycosyltransferase involved in cell wall biosynthesis